LKAWATANEMEHNAAFTRFKNALAANSINYDRLIAVASADRTARLEANATASLTLYCDAKATNDRFARRRYSDAGRDQGADLENWRVAGDRYC